MLNMLDVNGIYSFSIFIRKDRDINNNNKDFDIQTQDSKGYVILCFARKIIQCNRKKLLAISEY